MTIQNDSAASEGVPERIKVVIRVATTDDWIGVAYCKGYVGDPSTIHEFVRVRSDSPLNNEDKNSGKAGTAPLTDRAEQNTSGEMQNKASCHSTDRVSKDSTESADQPLQAVYTSNDVEVVVSGSLLLIRTPHFQQDAKVAVLTHPQAHEVIRALIAVHGSPISQDTATVSAQTQNVTDKGSCPHLRQDFHGRVNDQVFMKCLDCGSSVSPESESYISSTLKEIRERWSGTMPQVQYSGAVKKDIDTLLSIIDSLQEVNQGIIDGTREGKAILHQQIKDAASNMKDEIVKRVREIADHYDNTTQPNTGTSIAKQTAHYILRELEAIQPDDLSGRNND